MPAKKAPEASSKSAPKAEKPVEKKQAGGAQKADQGQVKGGQGQGQKAGQASQAQSQSQAQPRKPISSDPVEAAIQRKLDDWEAKIAKFVEELDKNKKTADDEVATRKKMFTQQDNLRKQLKEISDSTGEAGESRKAAIANLTELKRVKILKQDEAKAIRDRLAIQPGRECDNAEGQEAYLVKIETQIKTVEKGLASSAYSLQEEKKKVDEISQLQKAKKIFKDYVVLREKITADKKAIDEITAELDKTKGSREATQAARTDILTQLDAIKEKIEASFQQGKDIAAARNVVWESKQAAHVELGKERDKLQELRKKKWQEQQEKRKEEWEKEQARRSELAEKRKERDAERQKEEDLKIPYENEIDICTNLTQYLESLLPSKPKEATSSPAATRAAVPEGDVTVLKKDDGEEEMGGKKKGGKKQKAIKTTQDLKHNIEVFGYFEALSLAPPKKVADIETSIKEIEDKKAHFSKLSTASIAARQESAKAAAAAAAAQKASETAAVPAEPKAEVPPATANEEVEAQ